MDTVLIVDDEPSIRMLLGRWCTHLGFATRQADNAESALAAMRERQADIVLCDVRMPGHGGLWLVGQVRERYPDTAIVLATAVDEIPGTMVLQCGVTAYLLKPFKLKETADALQAAREWRELAVGRRRTARAADVDLPDLDTLR